VKENVRRIVMFCTILTLGLILIFFDVTFVQLLVMILAIAFVLPFILGLVTIAEVRSEISNFKEKRLKKIGFLKKLDDIKFFERKPGKIPPKVPVKEAGKPLAPVSAKEPAQKTARGKIPFGTQIQSLITSLKSFGSAIKIRGKPDRKVSEINSMLDSTVSQKVEKNPPPGPATTGTLPAPAAGGAGPGGSGASKDEDPFLSLSGDEFDAGLLDGLDELDTTVPAPEVPAGPSGTGLPEPELSTPALDIEAAAGDILKESGSPEGGLEEFGSLEGTGVSDSEFGDLDNLSLDDVDLEAELDEDAEGSPAAPAETPEAPAASTEAATAPAESSSAVKTTWIPSDAPKDADLTQDQLGIQSDMASFASASGGTDEDLLSSIASDVKHKTKERDLSLLRELKDFKAPADEIEKELTDMYKKLSAAQKPKEEPQNPNQ